MANPAEDLIDALDAVELPPGVNIYAGPAKEIEAPAIVIRPDSLWLEPDRFCFATERYLAIAAVSASSPVDGIAMLRLLSLAIIGALPEPWDWESVEGPLIDETTGQPFLANRIRLTYKVEAP